MKVEITLNDSVVLRAIAALSLLVEDATTPVTLAERNDLAALESALQIWRRKRLAKLEPAPNADGVWTQEKHDRWAAAYRWHLAHHKPVALYPYAAKV